MTRGVFRCPECCIVDLSSSDMAEHCQRHKDVHKFARCCDELFFTKPTYQKHCLEQHTRPLVCPQCERAFPNKTELTAHRMAYTKIYVCPMCGCDTGTMSTMRKHIEDKHAVIIDQKYVIIKTIKSDAKQRRRRLFKYTVWKKFLRMTVPCCMSSGFEGRILDDYFPFAPRFDDDSYSCRSLDRNYLIGTPVGLSESAASHRDARRHFSETESTSLSFD